MIRGSFLLPRVPGGYEGVGTIHNFPYTFTVSKENDQIRVIVSDTPDGFRSSVGDAELDAYIDRAVKVFAG